MSTQTAAVSETDLAAIERTALDYIEGWYEGDAERMERALHPELAKRIVLTDPSTGEDRLQGVSALGLVQSTRLGKGTKTPPETRRTEVTILHAAGRAASVRIDATDWVDYMHIGLLNGKWLVVNVLWEPWERENL